MRARDNPTLRVEYERGLWCAIRRLAEGKPYLREELFAPFPGEAETPKSMAGPAYRSYQGWYLRRLVYEGYVILYESGSTSTYQMIGDLTPLMSPEAISAWLWDPDALPDSDVRTHLRNGETLKKLPPKAKPIPVVTSSEDYDARLSFLEKRVSELGQRVEDLQLRLVRRERASVLSEKVQKVRQALLSK